MRGARVGSSVYGDLIVGSEGFSCFSKVFWDDGISPGHEACFLTKV